MPRAKVMWRRGTSGRSGRGLIRKPSGVIVDVLGVADELQLSKRLPAPGGRGAGPVASCQRPQWVRISWMTWAERARRS